jgi:hypothetical protein
MKAVIFLKLQARWQKFIAWALQEIASITSRNAEQLFQLAPSQ